MSCSHLGIRIDGVYKSNLMKVFCISGVGTNACLVPGLTMVAKYFDKKRSKAMGVMFTFIPVGTLAISPIIQYLFIKYDYFGSFLILAGIVMHCAISSTLMRPLPTRKFKENDDSNNGEDDVVINVVPIDPISKKNEDILLEKSKGYTGSTRSILHVPLEGSILDLRMDDNEKLPMPSCRMPKNMSDTNFEMMQMKDGQDVNTNNGARKTTGRERGRKEVSHKP